jgi:hypothetical protein
MPGRWRLITWFGGRTSVQEPFMADCTPPLRKTTIIPELLYHGFAQKSSVNIGIGSQVVLLSG